MVHLVRSIVYRLNYNFGFMRHPIAIIAVFLMTAYYHDALHRRVLRLEKKNPPAVTAKAVTHPTVNR